MLASDALRKIKAPKDATTVLLSLLERDLGPLIGSENPHGESITYEQALLKYNEACSKLSVERRQWARRGYAADKAYWYAVSCVLKATSLLQSQELPDLPLPSMDVPSSEEACRLLEEWATQLLSLTGGDLRACLDGHLQDPFAEGTVEDRREDILS